MSKVYLVGAGPGDMDLITVKGLDKLKRCDAVVYDRLVSEELLTCLRPDCERIYVGKQAGRHYKKQEEINEILVECAKRHRIVVRLKGGDPFVFGRGTEEITALQEHDIPYEVIPGITSAVAVPECAGIPVTDRGISRSFHVITGHTKDSKQSPDYDYKAIAGYEGTLVFLMGLFHLEEIANRLIAAGKPSDTCVAVIASGTTPNQQVVRGTLKEIAEKVKKTGIESPAVIVVGKTAEYEYLCQDLRNKKVGVTATGLLWDKLKYGLEGMGMQPFLLCNMNVVLTEQIRELKEQLLHLDRYQWVLFTSQNAIRLFFDEMKKMQLDIRTLAGLSFAVLGSGTKAKLLEYGIQADFIPAKYTVSVLAQEFSKVVNKGERVLIPRAVKASKELSDIFTKKNIAHNDIAIYDVVGSATANLDVVNQLDYLVFVSASGVRAFFAELKKKRISLKKSIKIACIGEVTRKQLLFEYGEADVVAAVNDVKGLLQAIEDYELLTL